MNRHPPPPVIDSARVISYAYVDDIPYQKAGDLLVDDELVEKVPRLAIGINLGEDSGPLLFHCDEHWQSLAISGADSVDEVKSQAERNYPGVAARWVDTHVTPEVAMEFYDSQTDGMRCSFCGKRPFEVESWVRGTSAVICGDCVKEFHRGLRSGNNSAGG